MITEKALLGPAYEMNKEERKKEEKKRVKPKVITEKALPGPVYEMSVELLHGFVVVSWQFHLLPHPPGKRCPLHRFDVQVTHTCPTNQSSVP